MTDTIDTYAEQSIRIGSKSFALAAKFFDKKIRNDVFRLYAWCRHCDDVIDNQVAGFDARQQQPQSNAVRLAYLRKATDQALAGAPNHEFVFKGLAKIASKHKIDPKHPRTLIAGFEMDVKAREYLTIADTLDYGYHVAGVVGLMMATIMGVRDPITLSRASDLGIGFQLTNIARDIYEDANVGRIYVPTEILEAKKAPTSPEEIAAGKSNAEVHNAALSLLDIAEDYYSSANIGIEQLPLRSRMAIRAAARIYREIGEEIRRCPSEALMNRTHTTALAKSWLASRAIIESFTRKQNNTPRSPMLYQRPE